MACTEEQLGGYCTATTGARAIVVGPVRVRPGYILRSLSLAALIATTAVTNVLAQEAQPALPPLPRQLLHELRKDPEAWSEFVAQYASAPTAEPVSTEPIQGLAWTPLKNPLPFNLSASNPLLLTDGTVLVHVSCTAFWYRLQPDIHGSYLKGTWSSIYPMVVSNTQGYGPRFFASAILPDGRVIIEGGEYNSPCKQQVETTLGGIYDPRTNAWERVLPPDGWSQVGDASGAVLGNGTFMLSTAAGTGAALLDIEDLLWSPTGSGKFDSNSEENWTLLPNGNLLTVDAYVGTGTCGKNTEEYDPATGGWTTAGSTHKELSGCSGSVKNFEAPTQILRPNGTVDAFGATASLASQNLPVSTAIYDTTTEKWAAGPDMPQLGGVYYTMADAPSAVLPNGEVLIAASPSTWTAKPKGQYPPPTHFFVFDGKKFTQVGDVADSAGLNSYEMNFLVLPTGEILGVETDKPNMEIFPAVCCADPSWVPTVTNSPASIVAGGTYTISGTQFNGLTYGSSYGDDEQASTNYPLVRVTKTSNKRVTYCATFNFSGMGVATGSATVSTDFTCNAPSGTYTLEVVANGIASAPVNIAIKARLNTLHTFCSKTDCTDGKAPTAGLIMDSSGNLYGTTMDGGTGNQGFGGTIFEVPFHSTTEDYGAVKVLYNFCSLASCADGTQPIGGLIMDIHQNLFGTTSSGGTGSAAGGTIFELPFDRYSHKYADTVQTLYSFCSAGGNQCTDGSYPQDTLLIDWEGNLFGTTTYGGTNSSAGTLFELSYTPSTQQYASSVTTLYNFCDLGACADGSEPYGGLIIDNSRNLYGTTVDGGTGYYAAGTLFELPFDTASNEYASSVQTLYSFCSQGGSQCTDGDTPYGSLIIDDAKNLYGTTGAGGNGLKGSVDGTVFELPFDATSQQYGTIQTLYSFCSLPNCDDGGQPYAGLVMDRFRNLYGTTRYGGAAGGLGGTVFELPFDFTTQQYADTLSSYYFDNGYLAAPLFMDGLTGTIYGTAEEAGTFGSGTVFTLSF